MKLPELKKRFTRKYVIRIIAGVLVVGMVGTGVSTANVFAAKTAQESTESTESTEKDSEKDDSDAESKLKDALDKHQNKEIDVRVTNIDRSFGTLFGSEITKKYGTSLEEDTSKYATDFTKLQEIMDEKTKLENELQVKYERWEYLNNLAEEIANWSNN